MTTTRRFTCDDLFHFSSTNLDALTETYHLGFYSEYLAKFPALCCLQEAPNGRIMSYILGKAEGAGEDWHGHVSAVTVAPEYRRLGLARRLMQELERVSEDIYRGFFVDLFVRASNVTAITMYQKLGYAVFRRVIGYYGRTSAAVDDSEDAFDMRRACPRNASRKIDAMVPLSRPIKPHEMWPTDGSKPLP